MCQPLSYSWDKNQNGKRTPTVYYVRTVVLLKADTYMIYLVPPGLAAWVAYLGLDARGILEETESAYIYTGDSN
jgi:hypothetical protein